MQGETYQLFALFLATAFFLVGAFLDTFLRAGEVFFGGAFLTAAFFLDEAFLAVAVVLLDLVATDFLGARKLSRSASISRSSEESSD